MLINPESRAAVEQVIVAEGAEVLPVKIDRQGVQVISR
jgi:hypothetical protein